ncbi:hypothetical protein [Frigidibacter sp. ROC022]|uniref:hypothetical protein n=1 Tax=Frigidibacter sp. ROC022 TaxID=2971796 RepID=UPI00215B5040|nr:hypothetical protein [Frigidibacter sp. ROC022]MCR8724582.1 hypothetical protein [Frigidibacter sp. ROC022]
MTAADPFRGALRAALREAVAGRPRLWRAICRLRGATQGMVSASTVVVCEGYQRSGNSFAEAALMLTQGDIEIAHHRHVAAQLLHAVRIGTPALLLIRDPCDAVASAVLRRPRDTGLRRELKSWINFNRACLPIAEQLVISDFPVTTSHFTAVLAALSARSGRSFSSAGLDDATIAERAFAEIARISERRGTAKLLNYGPHLSAAARAARTRALQEMKSKLETQHADDLARARDIHARLRSRSVAIDAAGHRP